MDDKTILKFPEPVVIYLTKESNIPEESVLILDFCKQGSFEYKVENYIYLNHDVIELNQSNKKRPKGLFLLSWGRSF